MTRCFLLLISILLLITAACADEESVAEDRESSIDAGAGDVGEDSHPYEDQCESACSTGPDECVDEAEECLQDCLAFTEDLDEECVDCLITGFEVYYLETEDGYGCAGTTVGQPPSRCQADCN